MSAFSVAVTSGKGGVGKSVIAANLAVALGRAGRRVLLVDGDLGLGNLSMLLGLNPDAGLEDVLSGRRAASSALTAGPEGIAVLCTGADADTDRLRQIGLTREVVEELERLEEDFDYVIVDTGAGIAEQNLTLVAAAAAVLLVITPEPTSVGDAYATLKMLRQRRLEGTVGLVVNMAESHDDALDLYSRFAELAARFLNAQIDNWGHIPLDRNVRTAVMHQIPLVLTSPPTSAAVAVAELAGVVVRDAAQGSGPRRGFFAAVRDAAAASGGSRREAAIRRMRGE